MIHQYHAHRYRYLPDGRAVGTIPVGSIIYIQDSARPLKGISNAVCRNPWIVEAWLNREYHVAVPGKPNVTMMAGGHLARVRSLRDGRIKTVADWMLLMASDAGLERAA